MPAAKGQRRTTRSEREAAVMRVLRGEPDTLVAYELGLSVQSVRSWIDNWWRRVGSWHGRPLEQAAIDLGYELEPADFIGARRIVRRTKAAEDVARMRPDAERALDELLTILSRTPIESRTALEQAYQRLDDSARALVGPAYDLYLQAADMMDGVRRTQRAAAALAARELADSKRAPIARAA